MSKEEIKPKGNLEQVLHPPGTNEKFDAITLNAIDLSLYKEGTEHLEQRKQLARSLEESISTYGFFNIVNFGLSREFVDQVKTIGYETVALPSSVKSSFLASTERKEDEVVTEEKLGGERDQGFKPKGYWEIKEGVRDSITHYNVRETYHDSFVAKKQKHPPPIADNINVVARYFNHIHQVVLPRLLSLCDLILGIEEGTLISKYFAHYGTNQDSSNSHGRFMLYQPYEKQEYSKLTESVFLRGHSDISAFSFITSLPILALQIKNYYNGNWTYVNHRPDSLIVNIGDSLEFISGGYFKACLHRVVEPPKDQRHLERLVVIYFCNPSDEAELDPELLNSAFLLKLGYSKEDKLKEWQKIPFKRWNEVKGKLLGRTPAGERNTLKLCGRYVERWHHFENRVAS